jgi:WD40 repeat protein
VRPFLVPQVWDSKTLECLKTLEGHEDNVRVLAVGERYVFSGSWDKSIRWVGPPATMLPQLCNALSSIFPLLWDRAAGASCHCPRISFHNLEQPILDMQAS